MSSKKPEIIGTAVPKVKAAAQRVEVIGTATPKQPAAPKQPAIAAQLTALDAMLQLVAKYADGDLQLSFQVMAKITYQQETGCTHVCNCKELSSDIQLLRASLCELEAKCNLVEGELKGLECSTNRHFLQTIEKLAALARDVAPDSHAENLKIWEAMNSTNGTEHGEAIERCKAEIAAFKLQISEVTSEIDKQQGNLIACASSDVALLLLAKF